MKKSSKVIVGILLLANIVLIIIYFANRKPIIEEVTVLVPGDTVYVQVDSLNDLNPTIDSTDVPEPTDPETIIIYVKDSSGIQSIDTMAIKKRYEKIIQEKDSLIAELSLQRHYSDTVVSDTSEVRAIVNFGVQYNRLKYRHYSFMNTRPKIINQTTVTYPTNALYWGINTGYSFDMDVMFGINIDYTFNKSLIGIGASTGFKPDNKIILIRYGQKF